MVCANGLWGRPARERALCDGAAALAAMQLPTAARRTPVSALVNPKSERRIRQRELGGKVVAECHITVPHSFAAAMRLLQTGRSGSPHPITQSRRAARSQVRCARVVRPLARRRTVRHLCCFRMPQVCMCTVATLLNAKRVEVGLQHCCRNACPAVPGPRRRLPNSAVSLARRNLAACDVYVVLCTLARQWLRHGSRRPPSDSNGDSLVNFCFIWCALRQSVRLALGR